MSLAAICNQVPRSVGVRIGGKVRASSSTTMADGTPGYFTAMHCNSCHEDHAEGYFGEDESWVYDDWFIGGQKYEEKRKGNPPWALRFCCCTEALAFEEALKDWLRQQECATIKETNQPAS